MNEYLLTLSEDKINAAMTEAFPGVVVMSLEDLLRIAVDKGWRPRVGLYDSTSYQNKKETLWEGVVVFGTSAGQTAIAYSDPVSETPSHAVCRALLYAAAETKGT